MLDFNNLIVLIDFNWRCCCVFFSLLFEACLLSFEEVDEAFYHFRDLGVGYRLGSAISVRGPAHLILGFSLMHLPHNLIDTILSKLIPSPSGYTQKHKAFQVRLAKNGIRFSFLCIR